MAATVVSASQKMDVANQPCNKSKNRYETITPFDNNRVQLAKLLNTDGSDYINASYIDTYTEKKSFIATQAPLVGTVADFWRMVYEAESWVIVLLGQEIEKGQVLHLSLMVCFCDVIINLSLLIVKEGRVKT